MFGLGLVFSIILLFVAVTAVAWSAYHFVSATAPPLHISIASGPQGSAYQQYARSYSHVLAKHGITLHIKPSSGSADNLKKLLDPQSDIDVGFVQSGVPSDIDKSKLMSLGSVANQPLMIFYRGDKKTLLSQFAGQRLAIGPNGSGTRLLALDLLAENGIKPGGESILLYTAPHDSAAALREDRIDALFLMGESAPMQVIEELRDATDIYLYNFMQAEAYSRRIKYLTPVEVPTGSFDLGRNLPSTTLRLVAPTVELIARHDLHPAISDLFLEAATDVHGGGGLLRRAGEFPAPLAHEFPLSQDAERYYESGKSFLYRTFPFWLASLMSRIIAILAPILLLLLPAMRILPAIYRWRMEARIFRWYGILRPLEHKLLQQPDPQTRLQLYDQIAEIEMRVNEIRVPTTFANLVYDLREHINFVRGQLYAEQENRPDTNNAQT